MKLFAFFIVFFFVSDGLGGPRNGPACPQIKLRFGRVRYRQRGKMARFVCNTGYMLAGDRYSVCTNGQWDNTFTRCVRATCQKVKPPANGLIYPSHAGAVLNFFCKSNFELRGPNITYCDGDKWDNSLPSCLPTNSTPPLSCDFEQEDICGWNHDPNHDFDWKRLNYATPSGSIGTGPSYDHTKGKGKGGYYMYIESSARNINDTARLISPIYDKSTEDVCFEFYYHMYGATTGDLRVYLKTVNDSWSLDPNKAIFWKRGNQGNQWYREVLELGTIDDDYQIIIEGVRGSSYVSDIAIDDVKIIPKCVPEDLIISTTEDTMFSSEPPLAVESCENRCQTNETQEIDSMLTCDCDEGCFYRNRCCPDYFDFCVFGTSTDDFMEETTLAVGSTSTTQTRTSRTTLPTTMKSIPNRTSKTTLPTTMKSMPTTSNIKKRTTLASTTIIKKKESKIVYVTPPSDLATLMTRNTEEVQTPGLPPYKKEMPVEEKDSDKTVTQKIIIPFKSGESNTKSVIFAVGVVFGALFAAAGMAFVAKRYRLCRCVNLKRLNQSSNGDSQSDVRFLTGDEILDLNLPSDYHTM